MVCYMEACFVFLLCSKFKKYLHLSGIVFESELYAESTLDEFKIKTPLPVTDSPSIIIRSKPTVLNSKSAVKLIHILE